MFPIARLTLPAVLRVPRRLLAAFVIGIYLIAGMLHGVCDSDVTNPAGKTVISLADNSSGSSDKVSAESHHCHGCFSVSVPSFVSASMAVDPLREVAIAGVVVRDGLLPGLDPPPPKFLI